MDTPVLDCEGRCFVDYVHCTYCGSCEPFDDSHIGRHGLGVCILVGAYRVIRIPIIDIPLPPKEAV